MCAEWRQLLSNLAKGSIFNLSNALCVIRWPESRGKVGVRRVQRGGNKGTGHSTVLTRGDYEMSISVAPLSTPQLQHGPQSNTMYPASQISGLISYHSHFLVCSSHRGIYLSFKNTKLASTAWTMSSFVPCPRISLCWPVLVNLGLGLNITT